MEKCNFIKANIDESNLFYLTLLLSANTYLLVLFDHFKNVDNWILNDTKNIAKPLNVISVLLVIVIRFTLVLSKIEGLK